MLPVRTPGWSLLRQPLPSCTLTRRLVARVALRQRWVTSCAAAAGGASKQALNDLQGGSPERQHEEDFGTVLDQYIGPGLQLMEQRVSISGKELRLIVPRSSDAVMDMYIDAGREDRDPYWCRAWPSALALGQLLLQKPQLVRGKRVCEIGAGLGIAGICAALAGAGQVVLTDREPLALECAARSAAASGLPDGRCSALDPRAVLATSLLDWTAESPGLGTFDTVLACDVLYEKPAVDPIARLVPKLLEGSSTGQALLADPESRTKGHRDGFLELVTSGELLQMAVETSETTPIVMDGITTTIRVVLLVSGVERGTVGVKRF